MDFGERGNQQAVALDPFGRASEVMDLGEKGNRCKEQREGQAQSDILERIAARRAWLKREREARGLSGNACLDCGEPMEEKRLEIDLPDCEKCRRERVQNGLPIREMVFSQR